MPLLQRGYRKMSDKNTVKLKHIGRIPQIGIYFGKFLRMFVYQSDWKVIPIGMIIAAVVTLVVGSNMFVTQEGTTNGTFALTCVCIWNGIFNSIQVVCRERDIVKREHRSGMHISSYICAHMLYQLMLCVMQTIVTLIVCWIVGIHFPETGVVTPSGVLDFAITILLVTYTADVIGLMISCIVKSTTTAMTVMPFVLIFQLVFSGGIFDLGSADFLKVATISHWGIDSLCVIGRFNEQPMVTLWNTMVRFSNVEIEGQKPVLEVIRYINRNNGREAFLLWSGQQSAKPAYEAVAANVLICWGAMLAMILLFALIAIIALKFIDRDKR